MTDTSSDRPPSRLAQWLSSIFKPKNGNGTEALREALEDIIDEIEEDDDANPTNVTYEKILLENFLELRELTVEDIMIPRADIAALDKNASQEEIFALLGDKQYSRIPVYDESLDNIIGTVHLKDIVSQFATNKKIDLTGLLRDIPIVSPALPVLELLHFMREEKKHMVMVVDEYGGTDGLATISDVMDEIIGEVDDEFDAATDPEMIQKPDGTIHADARLEIEDLEETLGEFLDDEEREEIDTVGGLVFTLAGRVPARGEVIEHPQSGHAFEILDADQRKVTRVRIRPASKAA